MNSWLVVICTGAPGSVFLSQDEDITCTGAYRVVATISIVGIHGLQGKRDVTLFHYVKIIKPPTYMTGDKYGFHPNLGDANEWKFSYGMVSSAAIQVEHLIVWQSIRFI